MELTPALIGSTRDANRRFCAADFSGRHHGHFLSRAGTRTGDGLAGVVVSGNFFFTPVLARMFFKPRPAVSAEEAEQANEGRVMRWLTTRYESVLHWTLAHAGLMVLVSSLSWRPRSCCISVSAAASCPK
ncbi:MAG: hypothetical protein U0Y68_23820 [Blastocatellia bacterium]